jgi:hypothetical protein
MFIAQMHEWCQLNRGKEAQHASNPRNSKAARALNALAALPPLDHSVHGPVVGIEFVAGPPISPNKGVAGPQETEYRRGAVPVVLTVNLK